MSGPGDKVPDDTCFSELVERAARVLVRAGLQHRIDIYRDVEIEDPAVLKMLGRPHRVRVRVKITAASLLFDEEADLPAKGASPPAPIAAQSARLPAAGDYVRPLAVAGST